MANKGIEGLMSLVKFQMWFPIPPYHYCDQVCLQPPPSYLLCTFCAHCAPGSVFGGFEQMNCEFHEF